MRVEVCGLAVDAITAEEALASIERAVAARRDGGLARPLAVFSANVDMAVKAAGDPGFARDLAEADFLLLDGVPLVWMARSLGARVPERVAGVDLVQRIAARAAAKGWSLFLLGAAHGVAERAAAVLAVASPGLRIAGTLSPPLRFEEDPAARERVIAALAATRPDIVLVALGAPRQERWILSQRERIAPAAFLGVGGSFDLIAGERRRAPGIVQRAGLEWAWRMAQEPLRLGRRYLLEDAAIVPLYARDLWRRLRGGACAGGSDGRAAERIVETPLRRRPPSRE